MNEKCVKWFSNRGITTQDMSKIAPYFYQQKLTANKVKQTPSETCNEVS